MNISDIIAKQQLLIEPLIICAIPVWGGGPESGYHLDSVTIALRPSRPGEGYMKCQLDRDGGVRYVQTFDTIEGAISAVFENTGFGPAHIGYGDDCPACGEPTIPGAEHCHLCGQTMPIDR